MGKQARRQQMLIRDIIFHRNGDFLHTENAIRAKSAVLNYCRKMITALTYPGIVLFLPQNNVLVVDTS